MKLELKFGVAFCNTPHFRINGVYADSADFGEQYDRSPNIIEEASYCEDMKFTRIPPKSSVLAKYNITEAEYALIASQLEHGLSFGSCSFCVF